MVWEHLSSSKLYINIIKKKEKESFPGTTRLDELRNEREMGSSVNKVKEV